MCVAELHRGDLEEDSDYESLGDGNMLNSTFSTYLALVDPRCDFLALPFLPIGPVHELLALGGGCIAMLRSFAELVAFSCLSCPSIQINV